MQLTLEMPEKTRNIADERGACPDCKTGTLYSQWQYITGRGYLVQWVCSCGYRRVV